MFFLTTNYTNLTNGRTVCYAPLTGAGYETGDPFTQGQAPVLGYVALTGQKVSLISNF